MRTPVLCAYKIICLTMLEILEMLKQTSKKHIILVLAVAVITDRKSVCLVFITL